MQWQSIDFDARLLTIPESKTGRRTQVLSGAAVELLATLPRFDNYVFAGGRSYKVVRRVFAEAAANAGIVDARIHDLRRNVMTNAAANGIAVHVLRDLLGHKTTATATSGEPAAHSSTRPSNPAARWPRCSTAKLARARPGFHTVAEFGFHNLPRAFVEAHRTPTDELVRRSSADRVAYEALVVLARIDVLSQRAGITVARNAALDSWSRHVAA